jgi:branched-chain amino acid aminotransferase
MFDTMPGRIWLDGEMVEWTEAQLHVMSHALHYASSVFEGLRSYDGRLFKGTEHYERFHQSARHLDFEVPYATEELLRATEALIADGGLREGYVRALAWCGSKVMTVSHRGADVRTMIAAWERPQGYPEHFFTQGIRMTIAKWRRPDPRTAPVHSKASGLYMTSSMDKKSAELLGFDDALVLDYKDCLAEATSSNLFLVIDGILHTPIPDCFLNGITRLTVLDIAGSLGISARESRLTLEDLSRASEVFLTGTAVEILPVGSIEGHGQRWSFRPGAVTEAIRTDFRRMTRDVSMMQEV